MGTSICPAVTRTSAAPSRNQAVERARAGSVTSRNHMGGTVPARSPERSISVSSTCDTSWYDVRRWRNVHPGTQETGGHDERRPYDDRQGLPGRVYGRVRLMETNAPTLEPEDHVFYCAP